jgi:hypothetical protein
MWQTGSALVFVGACYRGRNQHTKCQRRQFYAIRSVAPLLCSFHLNPCRVSHARLKNGQTWACNPHPLRTPSILLSMSTLAFGLHSEIRRQHWHRWRVCNRFHHPWESCHLKTPRASSSHRESRGQNKLNLSIYAFIHSDLSVV